MHNTSYIIILYMMCRCASIHNDMPFTFVWLFSDSSTSSVPSMSSSGKDINMYQHVWNAFLHHFETTEANHASHLDSAI